MTKTADNAAHMHLIAADSTGRLKARQTVQRLKEMAGNTWLLLLILVIWELCARTSPSVFLPPFSSVAQRFFVEWMSTDPTALFLSEQFYQSVGVSLKRLAIGWGLAVVLGVLIGVLLGTVNALNRMYAPIVRFWIAVPNAILLPIAVKAFGVNDSMNIFLICFGTIWLIIIKTSDGVRNIDPMYFASARSMHLDRLSFYRYIVLPAAMPEVFSGLRISIGIGLILMIISEFFATTGGLGYDIQMYQQTFQYELMWSAFLLIGVLSVIINSLLGLIERRVLHWQRRTDAIVEF